MILPSGLNDVCCMKENKEAKQGEASPSPYLIEDKNALTKYHWPQYQYLIQKIRIHGAASKTLNIDKTEAYIHCPIEAKIVAHLKLFHVKVSKSAIIV
jgi:hypothetical protein